MENLVKFLSLLQLTREQPQYGYFLAGLKRHETSNLAEHHYLVSMVGWLLSVHINAEEKLIDTDRVLKMCLVHDLGELFGGDIAAPLSRKRPDMKEYARELERANLTILCDILSGISAKEIKKLWEENENNGSDEALIAQIADKIETHFFLEHHGVSTKAYPSKDSFYQNHIRGLANNLKNEKIQRKLELFFQAYETHVKDRGFRCQDWIIGQ